MPPDVYLSRVSQTAERLFWILLTLRLVPPGFFWAGWTLWSQSWPVQSAWSSLKTRCCSPALTACALAAPTAFSSPTAPPTNPFRALVPSSALPVDMSFPWVLSVDSRALRETWPCRTSLIECNGPHLRPDCLYLCHCPTAGPTLPVKKGVIDWH